MGSSHSGIYKEMLIRNNNLFLEIFLFFLLQFTHFFDHIVTRNEYSIEIGWIRECPLLVLVLDFAVEVCFAMIFWSVDCRFEFLLGIILLLNERNLKVIHHRLGRLLGMLVIICLLVQSVKSCLGFPSRFTLLLFLYLDLILIHKWERERQVFLRIGVEIGRIVGNMLT